MRALTILFIALFALLQYAFWFGQGSILSAWRLKSQIATQQQKNNILKQRNDAIRADIHDLKSGNQAVEERARYEMGMVKKGETFYQIVHKDKVKND
jgi:cell division protein FtsB